MAALAKSAGKPANGLMKRIAHNYDLYLLFLPVIVYYVVFHYVPMYGIVVAFKDYVPTLGAMKSPWVGLQNFKNFFSSFYFTRIMKNTLGISFMQLIFGFPASIILALFINELKNGPFKKVVQNATFIPHFLSTVVIVGMVVAFTKLDSGIINIIIQAFGGKQVSFMESVSWFKPLFVLSGIWQNMGWDSMIYIGALAGINPELFEAASIDGASRFQKMIRISIPCILPTIIILLLLNLGRIMNVGFEKALLMQNNLNMDSSDIISTFVYQRGILRGDYGLSTAVGLFNSAINCILLLTTNKITKMISGSGIF